MLDKIQALAIAAFLALGGTALVPPTSANATPFPMAAVGGAGATNPAGELYQETATRDQRRRQWYYDRRYHGPRYRYSYGGYRYYYGGYWYDRPYWNLTIPFIFAPPVPRYYYQPRYRNFSARHIDWCLARYRSYNVRSNTWVSYSGQVRQCISPFGP